MKKIIYLLFVIPFVFSSCTSIPDEKFEQALIDLGIDSDGVINQRVWTLSISRITTLDVQSKGISDLTGIEDFSSLTYLNCDNNNLTSLNISQNTALETLWCNWNQLISLDVSGATALKTIWCSQNQLTSLDVSQNSALELLNCHYNKLSSLDVSQNSALKELICWHNELSTINISQNNALTHLACGINRLTNLDLGGATALEILSCNKNYLLQELDVSQNTVLKSLNCIDNKLTYLNVKNGNNAQFTFMNATYNPLLTCIDVDNAGDANAGIGFYNIWKKDDTAHFSKDCLIYTYVPDSEFERFLELDDWDDDNFVLTSSINTRTGLFIPQRDWMTYVIRDITGIEDFTALEHFTDFAGLRDIDLSKNTALISFLSGDHSARSLLLPENTSLTTVVISYASLLSSLDLSKNPGLTLLSLGYASSLSSLDLSYNPSLTRLDIHGAPILENLDLSNNTALSYLKLSFLSLTDLDLSQNIALTSLDINLWDLASLNLKNGNNTILSPKVYGSQYLACIEVDRPDWSTANWSTYVDPWTIFLEDCSYPKLVKSIHSEREDRIKEAIIELTAYINSEKFNVKQYEIYKSEINKLITQAYNKR